jgi:hypothetical protein
MSAPAEPRASDPFKESGLNKIAAWWQMRPSDRGDGQGYTGYHLLVKVGAGGHIETTEFQSEELQDVIDDAVSWCKQYVKQPEQPKKRTIKRRESDRNARG